MRVLWFSVTPSMYAPCSWSHNGGGWIASLEALMRKVPNLELGIAFEHSDTCFRAEQDKVIYYPMHLYKSKWDRLKEKFVYEPEEKLLIPICLEVIKDFKPDIIHVFGSEWCFGLVAQHTDIPTVIHMQGSLPAYYNALYPAGYSKIDKILKNGINLKNTIKDLLYDKTFKLQAKREEKILRGCYYFMGRTEWDEKLTKLYAPNSKYFYCSEALRNSFVNNDKIWHSHDRNQIILASTISNPLYKGLDLILKTAKLITEHLNISFEWRVFGTKDIQFHESKTKIKAIDVNVKLMGTISSDHLKNELLNSDMYIHPSYIDNSPNSVCEAQILGLPIISTNVGGIASLIEHKITGLLVPANDPYTMVSYIKLLILDNKFASILGNNSRRIAKNRHNPEELVKTLLKIYENVIEDEKNCQSIT